MLDRSVEMKAKTIASGLPVTVTHPLKGHPDREVPLKTQEVPGGMQWLGRLGEEKSGITLPALTLEMPKVSPVIAPNGLAPNF